MTENHIQSVNLTAYQKCVEIAHNLWWSWRPEVVVLFRLINPPRWRALDHNPIAMLREYTPEEFERRVLELSLHTSINVAYRRFQKYISERTLWSRQNAGVLGSRPVAYFSLEFGIHESVPIYSGGLGILAGDHIKSASDLGVPLVAIGLFYSKGYFRQQIDANNNQVEKYVDTDVNNVPFEPVYDKDGNKLKVHVTTKDGPIYAQVRRIAVGRTTLLLLDTDVEENTQKVRELTGTLYGGDKEMRIRQELICGVGGVRALRALGIKPGVYHLNEGHNSFVTLEAIRELREETGLSFDEASRDIAQKTVFTTHTPVAAGHDYFSKELVVRHLEPLYTELGLSEQEFLALGRKDPNDDGEEFCMTILGMKLSRYANAVSSLHGVVTRRMWHSLWPDKREEDLPIGHVTNGVHVPTWMAPQIRILLERNLPNWTEDSIDPDVWSGVYGIDSGELWETHFALKKQLIDFARRQVSRQMRRNNASEEELEAAGRILDPDALTIGFARRFAEYKRAFLVVQDEERFDKIVNNPDRPVQFVFAGKAHPADNIGKAVIKKIIDVQRNPRFSNKVVFLEDYDITVARHLVQGVDVWLNNPRRPLEASGTSGQKAVLNGALNFSILDGWWAEAYDGTNGFAIGDGLTHVDPKVTDERDNAALLDALENIVVPTYYARGEHGVPFAWIRLMKNSMATLAWRFSAHRMVADYVKNAYLPAAGGLSAKMPR